jgi:hypothetical protein
MHGNVTFFFSGTGSVLLSGVGNLLSCVRSLILLYNKRRKHSVQTLQHMCGLWEMIVSSKLLSIGANEIWISYQPLPPQKKTTNEKCQPYRKHLLASFSFLNFINSNAISRPWKHFSTFPSRLFKAFFSISGRSIITTIICGWLKKTSPWTYMLTELDFPDASVLDCLWPSRRQCVLGNFAITVFEDGEQSSNVQWSL